MANLLEGIRPTMTRECLATITELTSLIGRAGRGGGAARLEHETAAAGDIGAPFWSVLVRTAVTNPHFRLTRMVVGCGRSTRGAGRTEPLTEDTESIASVTAEYMHIGYSTPCHIMNGMIEKPVDLVTCIANIMKLSM